MLQLINKNRIYFYLISFLFLSTISNKQYFSKFKKNFVINKIDIQIDKTYLKQTIFQKTKFLINNNIFFVNTEILKDEVNKLNYLENIEIKKNIPQQFLLKQIKLSLLLLLIRTKKNFF